MGCDDTRADTATKLFVSIHAPVWGATKKNLSMTLDTLFQSTHPCGVRRLVVKTNEQGIVSIHAPVWGATSTSDHFINEPSVSIHAPVWGATSSFARAKTHQSFNPRTRVGCDAWHGQSRKPPGFNPRTRVGCDIANAASRQIPKVSIHAPVWGATIMKLQDFLKCKFQSTHPCGVRQVGFSLYPT